MVNMAEKVFESFEDEGFLGRREVAEIGDAIGLGVIGNAPTLIGEVAVPSSRINDTGPVGGERVTASSAGVGSNPRPLGWTIDAVETMGAAPVAFGHGSAAFCLSRMASLAGLADSPSGRMSGDDMDVEGFGGGRGIVTQSGDALSGGGGGGV